MLNSENREHFDLVLTSRMTHHDKEFFLKKTPSEPQPYKLIAVAVYDLGWRQIEKKKKIDKQ